MRTWEKAFLEVSPPGREPQVRALKGKVGNPYAVAWASYNAGKRKRRGKKDKETMYSRSPTPFCTTVGIDGQKDRGGYPRGSADEAQLTSKKRKNLKKSSFALPGQRKYPIHDKAHARNALARVAQHGTPAEKAKVRKAVHDKYPGIGKEAMSCGGMPQTLRGMRDCEGGPGSGRHRTTPMHPKSVLKDPYTRDALAKTMRSYHKSPDSMALLRRMQGTSTARYESDRKILATLLKEDKSKHSYRFTESARFIEGGAAPAEDQHVGSAPSGPVIKCVLITEGLGNRHDMHYYGRECIETGAPLFEGKPCFVDHISKSGEEDRPERTVRDKCGYFTDVRAEEVAGRLGLVANLHYDLSETGELAYKKALTAIRYKQDLAGRPGEYVGLSISADGSLDQRTLLINGEELDVKYVTRFTDVGSVDQVTAPARGGRFLQVLAG